MCDDLPMSHPSSGPDAPQRQGLRGGIIVPIAIGIVLVLAVCCVGGLLVVTREDDEPERTATSDKSATGSPTESTTGESSTERTTPEPTTSEPSEPESSAGTEEPSETGGSPDDAVAFPARFGSWENLSSEPGSTIAIFTKGEETFNVLSSTHATVETYEKLWDSPQRHGKVSCGEQVGESEVSCAVEAHDTTYYATSSDLTEEELAGAVETMLTQM